MINPPAKVALGITSLVGIAGGGLLVKNYAFPSNTKSKVLISERLVKEGYILLDASKDGDWTNTINKHKETGFNYPRFILKTGQELNDLKEECKKILKNSDNEEDYKKAKKWCVKPMTVKELIASKNLNLLNITESRNNDQSKYQSLVDEYEKTGKGDKAISALVLSPSGNKDNNWSLLRAQCKALSEKEFWDTDYDNALSKVEMWCVSEAIKKE